MNVATLIGRITKDIDLRRTTSGTAVANFNLAVNRMFKSNDGQDADFINILVFGKTAENTAQYCSKGSLVGVSGRIQTRNYTNSQGNKVYVTEVVANEVQFLDTKKKESSNEQTNDFYDTQFDDDIGF
jgi:single-strand DNA-binding protein